MTADKNQGFLISKVEPEVLSLLNWNEVCCFGGWTGWFVSRNTFFLHRKKHIISF